MNYEYPIEEDWNTDEMIRVIEFFQTVEKAYENDVEANKMLEAYRSFKEIVPSKAQEKQLFKKFERQSNYVPYRVVKEAQAVKTGKIKMEK